MNLLNIKCENILLKVASGRTFQDVIDLLMDEKIIGFSCALTGKIISPLDEVTHETTLVKIYNSHLAANLLNAFSLLLKNTIVDFTFQEEKNFIRKCIVKFNTDNTFSEIDFDYYKDRIKEQVFLCKNNNSNEILNDVLCQNHLTLLPFDFILEKVAQEDFNGVKVQKFTIVIFQDPSDRETYSEKISLLKKIDHRYLGKKLDYFMMIPEAPGCAFWLPKGWKLFRNLQNFIRKYAYDGFNEVNTPLVMSNSFWEKSGHLVSFKQNMMFVNMGDNIHEDSALKPMNCPAHIEIFQRKIRSYKDLPLRIAEFGSCHRYEPSGSLHGLMRVRSLTQDDGHVFCSMEDIKSETLRFLNNCISIYKKLGFTDTNIILATKPDNSLGDPDKWIVAEKHLVESLKEAGLDFSIAEGEGAFYGPKIEVHVKDSIGRSWQLGTIQLDFVLPQRFNLFYVNKNGERDRVCMLHRAILGSLERFIGVLLEHSKGSLPIFLAPVQVMVCSVTEGSNEYAEKVHAMFIKHGIDAELDIRNETLAYKIREHKIAKVPVLVIIGNKESQSNSITFEYLNEKKVLNLGEIDKIMGIFNEN